MKSLKIEYHAYARKKIRGLIFSIDINPVSAHIYKEKEVAVEIVFLFVGFWVVFSWTPKTPPQ